MVAETRLTVVAPERVELVPHWKETVCPEFPLGSIIAFKVAEVPATEDASIVKTSTGNVELTVVVSVKVVDPHVPPAVV